MFSLGTLGWRLFYWVKRDREKGVAAEKTGDGRCFACASESKVFLLSPGWNAHYRKSIGKSL
jgi:hypothetical protein